MWRKGAMEGRSGVKQEEKNIVKGRMIEEKEGEKKRDRI